MSYVSECFEVSWMLSCRLKDLHIVIKTTCCKHRDARMRLQHVYLYTPINEWDGKRQLRQQHVLRTEQKNITSGFRPGFSTAN